MAATCKTQDSQAVTQTEGVTCAVCRRTLGEEPRDLCKTTQDVSIKVKHLAEISSWQGLRTETVNLSKP